MFFVASGSNLVLAALELYSFSGTRHALYLIPFVALISGAGAQWLWDMATQESPDARQIGVGVFALSTALTLLDALQHDLTRTPGGVAELPLLREHYEATVEFIRESARPGEILVGDKQLAYYAWMEGSMQDAERLSSAVGRTRLEGLDFYYYDAALVIENAGELARFVAGLEEVLDEPRPATLRFASLGWRGGLLYRLATPEVTASTREQPGDQALRSSLVRARTLAFNAGEFAGGGVAFRMSWKTLYQGLRQARRSSLSPRSTREGGVRP
jgi:hypothetical protein